MEIFIFGEKPYIENVENTENIWLKLFELNPKSFIYFEE